MSPKLHIIKYLKKMRWKKRAFKKVTQKLRCLSENMHREVHLILCGVVFCSKYCNFSFTFNFSFLKYPPRTRGWGLSGGHHPMSVTHKKKAELNEPPRSISSTHTPAVFVSLHNFPPQETLHQIQTTFLSQVWSSTEQGFRIYFWVNLFHMSSIHSLHSIMSCVVWSFLL